MRKARDAVLKVKTLLKNAGIEEYDFEANQLVCHFGTLSRVELLAGIVELNDEQSRKLDDAIKKRISGYPLQYILGEWEFYSLPFFVGDGVLIPRADTETLVQACIDFAGDKNLKILDLCSGSGCVAISLKKFLPNCKVIAAEKSEQALSYLRRNAERNNVELDIIKCDVLVHDFSSERFDIIVSNPPYLSAKDMQTLQTEVTHEPEMALYGISEDGLHFYRELTRLYTPILNDGGIFAFEVGISQDNDVEAIFKDNGYKTICKRTDLCDIIRVVYALN